MKYLVKFRKLFWSVVILGSAFGIYLMMSDRAGLEEKHREDSTIVNVPVTQVTSKMQSISFPVFCRIKAQQTIDIYSEVSGVLVRGMHDFMAATSFQKGNVIAQINSKQSEADLQALRSSLKAKLASILAIIKIDFPERFSVWSDYLASISPIKNLEELPACKTDRESLFITVKGVEELYYKIRSQEELLRKHTLKAPFSGELSSVLLKEGTLVNAGQKLGTFVGNTSFDIVFDVRKEYLKWINVNDSVALENDKCAIVKRVGSTMNETTQTVAVYAIIKDKSLRHGDYISGILRTSTKVKGYQIDRRLITGNSEILVEENNRINLLNVNQLLSVDGMTLISGLPQTFNLVTKISGLKQGQKIQPEYQ